MADSRPVELYVDTTELDRRRDELQTLQAELADLPAQQSMNADPAALGGDDVAPAVDRFAVHWTDGRARITENLGECRTLAEGAIQAYTVAENAIRDATPVPAGATMTETR